jgi:integrase
MAQETEGRKMSKRARGTGAVYQQPGSKNWWLRYYANCVEYRVTSGTPNRTEAIRQLNLKLGEIAAGKFVPPSVEKITVSEIVEDVFTDYQINGKKTLQSAKIRWNAHVQAAFGHLRAKDIRHEQFAKYIAARQADNAANATINRELALLKRAFTLAQESGKVTTVPKFPHLEERNVRQGFLNDAQYQALCDQCSRVGLWLRAMCEVGATFGWRVGELKTLRVGQVDLAARTIRLEVTKNGERREAVMPPLVLALIQQCITGKRPDDLVFTKKGKAIGDFRKTWSKVCEGAGVPDLFFHDLRRTGVRNMVRGGIPERVAMAISGHKTRSIFDRYNIVSHSDLVDAARRMEQAETHRNRIVETANIENKEFVEMASVPVQPGTVLN